MYSSLNTMCSRQSLLRALHEMLSAWRLSRAEWLLAVAEKTRARILGRLYILASRVTLKSVTETPHPQDTKLMLRVSSLEHGCQIADLELAIAHGAKEVGEEVLRPGGDVVPRPGGAPTGNDVAPLPSLISQMSIH